jgi:hypothetical protein
MFDVQCSSFPEMTNAVSALLIWSAAESPNVAGYKLYEGPAPRLYTNTFNCGLSTNHTVSNLVRGGTYYFALTAYNAQGIESFYSPEATFPAPVTNIATITAQILASPNLSTWSPLTNLVSASFNLQLSTFNFQLTNPSQPQFFRASMTITQTLSTSRVLKLDSSTLVITNQ